ncbi:unnamed protein product [Calypogeia fissa]
MRPNSRFVVTLVSRAWQQSCSASRRFDAHQGTSHPGAQLSRRLFSSQAPGAGEAGAASQHKKSIARAFPFWERSSSFRAIIVGVAASGCLGVLVVAADAKSSKEDALKDGEVKKKPKLVVLGTGWAGMSFVKEISTDLYDIQVVSPRNHFVFTPLLPSVTNGTVEARSIAEPIRRMFKHKGKQQVKLYEAECMDIDPVKKQLHCRDVSDVLSKEKENFIVDYDYLVIAVGGLSNTFGTEGVEEHCHFLKELEDAERIRQSVIDCFETASLPHLTDDERRRMLSFLIVGGGPTGVEFAAELHDLVHDDLATLYPSVQPFISVRIVQSGDHILNMFDERISQYAEKKFSRDGMDVKTNCRVLKVNDGSVLVKEKATGQEVEVPFGMAVWSTGLGTRPVISRYMEKIGQDNRRMLATDEWLRVKGDSSSWALGDCSTMEQRKVMEDIGDLFHKADVDNSGTLTVQEFKDCMELVKERYPQIELYMGRQHLKSLVDLMNTATAAGKQDDIELSLEQFKEALSKVDSQMKVLPATAQVAAQQGEYLAHCFNRFPNRDEIAEGPVRIHGEGRHRFRPFQYKHLGQFAPLGAEQCGAELPGDWVSVGRSTQWLWYSVYASKQVSWRTRALVLFDWTKRLFFGRDSSHI